MIQNYHFFKGGTVAFEDTRTVRELIAHAFDAFGYAEPFGMEIVTVFQGHHPETTTGWFTTDVSRRCAEEIQNPGELFFAYHLPNVFFFAEGGWGHHMKALGNHPQIPNAVELKLRLGDSRDTVILNGDYTFSQVVQALKGAGTIDAGCAGIRVFLVGCGKAYQIPCSDPVLALPLTQFMANLERYHRQYGKASADEALCQAVFSFE